MTKDWPLQEGKTPQCGPWFPMGPIGYLAEPLLTARNAAGVSRT